MSSTKASFFYNMLASLYRLDLSSKETYRDAHAAVWWRRSHTASLLFVTQRLRLVSLETYLGL